MVERAVYWGAGRFGGHVSTGIAVDRQYRRTPSNPPRHRRAAASSAARAAGLHRDSLRRARRQHERPTSYGGGFDGFGYVVTDDRAGIE